jgi:signal transduction histidine kinase
MNLKMSLNKAQPASATDDATEPAAASSRIGILGPLVVVSITAALTVIVANECHQAVSRHQPSAPYTPSLLYGITSWCWWGVYAFALWAAAARRPAILAFKWKNVSAHVATACLLCFLHLSLLQQVITWGSAYWPIWGKGIAGYVVGTVWRYGIDLAVYGCIYGFAGFLFAQIQAQKAAIQKLALERQLSEAQLQALQSQIEPHFLFNTLNAITSLVAQDRNDEALDTLDHLNTILRTTLQRKAPQKVPFAEELRVIESYLAIQKVRFADRLEVRIQATDDALQCLVPSLLLQPIVENAIQHGISPLESGGIVETDVHRVGNMLCMQVRDNGYGPAAISEKGHGIGIRNTRERLELFYPGAHEFAVASPPSGGYQVTIHIPYERTVA